MFYVDFWKKCFRKIEISLDYLKQQGLITQYGGIRLGGEYQSG